MDRLVRASHDRALTRESRRDTPRLGWGAVLGAQCGQARRRLFANPSSTNREIEMDPARAHDLIESERERVKELLSNSAAARADDLEAAADASTSLFDSASPLAQELLDDAVAEQLSARLAALDRASDRLRAGTYGISLHSGLPIPDERLEADPAAEVLVDEIANAGARGTSEARGAVHAGGNRLPRTNGDEPQDGE